MVLYGHQHPAGAAGVARTHATFDFAFPAGFCAGTDVASSSNSTSGCGGAYAAFYDGGSVLRSRDYGDTTSLFYPYSDHQVHAATNGHQLQSSIELCSGAAGSEFTAAAALCGSGQQPRSPTAVTANDALQRVGGGESNSATASGQQQQSSSGACTYKWMTVKRGAPKATGQSGLAQSYTHCPRSVYIHLGPVFPQQINLPLI